VEESMCWRQKNFCWRQRLVCGYQKSPNDVNNWGGVVTRYSRADAKKSCDVTSITLCWRQIFKSWFTNFLCVLTLFSTCVLNYQKNVMISTCTVIPDVEPRVLTWEFWR
jgi:hypothetical protein